jgi:DNA polymerase-3 subunit gamma/tau
MLSTAAFNAFLKTLEEPPSYAKFILATTEKHKILPTILSRCQIFDFHRIQLADIQGHLVHICEEEKITAEDDALHIIAQKADGGLRDALSIFDRMVSFCGSNIKYEDVIDNLNILDYDYFFRLIDAMLQEDVANVLLTYDKILRKGFDNEVFLNGLAAHLRNILISRDPITLQLLESGEAIKNRYLQQAQNTSMSFLLTALTICNECDVRYGQARDKKLHIQMHLIKMCFISRGIQLAEQKKNNLNSTAPLPENGVKKQSENLAAQQPVAVAPPAKMLSFAESKALLLQKVEEPPSDFLPKHASNQWKNEQSAAKLSGGSSDILSAIKAEAMREVRAEQEAPQDNSHLYTLDNLQKNWGAFAKNVESPTLQLQLNEAIPKLQLTEKTIDLVVTSTLAKAQIESEMALIELLRRELASPMLVFNIKVERVEKTADANALQQQTQNQAQQRLTDPEKLRLMADENTLVRDFFRKFDLKIEAS